MPDADEATYLTRAECAGLTNSADTDGDGVMDGCENRNWDDSRQGYEMDACNADSDGDGIPDGIEDDPTDTTVQTVVAADIASLVSAGAD